MTKTILMAAAVLIAGCADDPIDPFAESKAGAAWNAAAETRADAACAGRPTEVGEPCAVDFEYTNVEGQLVSATCTATFVIEGQRGCCIDAGYDIEVDAVGQPTRTRRVFFASCE